MGLDSTWQLKHYTVPAFILCGPASWFSKSQIYGNNYCKDYKLLLWKKLPYGTNTFNLDDPFHYNQ